MTPPTSSPVRADRRHLLLGGAPGDTALITAAGQLTYAELAERVEARAAELGASRRLVLLEAANDVDSVVTYLAALAGRHPVLLVGPGDAARHPELLDRYAPDVLATPGGLETRSGDDGSIHPDLAVLLSTSGSTGSPKLVRLSRANVLANAASIASYLGIRPTDRAITSLPLHYCYGLSVLNSHLLRGAAVVLTDHSVADECFWDLATETGVTAFAGVPYTFDLLDASGFARRDLPALRYITQAGGRMPPEQVRRYASLGRERGWDLFVMYGQTEATARMAYLPPSLALERPEAIGVPIPGGSFRLDPVAGLPEGTGELVYTGPNVMMGYAVCRADLARGPELDELRTGDLARQADDGLWEVTGRLSRFGKVFGLRVDLDRLERALGGEVRVVAPGEKVHVFGAAGAVRGAAAAVARLAGIPAAAVQAHAVDVVPRTPSGKPDYAALAELARSAEALAATAAPTLDRVTAESLRDLYAVVLGRPGATTADSFISLGGDSLSFVEISTRLGDRLGELPAGWQHLSIADLAEKAKPGPRRTVPVEMPALLRTVAILLILITHTDLVLIPGGAHLLLALTGYNIARFVLPVPGRGARVRRLLAAAAAVAVPASLWIAGCTVITGDYSPATAVLLNQALGEHAWSADWQFWFLETLVWTMAGLAALLAVPAVDRWQRARPFEFATALLLVGLAVRYGYVGVEVGPLNRYLIAMAAWCMLLGCAAAAATTTRQRALVGAIAVTAYAGYFGDPVREAIVAGGVLALLLWRSVRLPRPAAWACRVIGGASLWIYLTHWQVYPGLEAAGHPMPAIVASLLVGVASAWIWSRGADRVRQIVRRSTRIDPSASTSSNSPLASAGR